MILELKGNEFYYKLEAVIRLFYPAIKILRQNLPENYQGDYVSVKIETENAEELFFCVCANIDGKIITLEKRELAENPKQKEWILSRMLYNVLSEHTAETQPWGVLTGVRPLRLWRNLEEKGQNTEQIKEKFREDFLVSEDKIKLLESTHKRQRDILSDIQPDTFGLYISIPFCPTRCLYCSFVSHAISNTHKLMSEYVDLLIKELEETAKLAEELGLRLQSIYFGGGTPTQLSAKDLARIMKAIELNFDFSSLKEYTVEAGRPDTIDREKLAAMENFGVQRVSINPQTLNPEVLKTIGRSHNVEQFFTAYCLARKYNFDIINTDLIVGLPGETAESFLDGLQRIIDLSPENITVHTLTVKRSSRYIEWEDAFDKSRLDIAKLLNDTQEILALNGYNPYYLYRQKGTKDNHENVGFALNGTESYYNIGMMEDVQTVLGVGAGSTTKLVLPNGKIKRVYNFKYPYEYNDRFKEIKQRKDKVRRILNERD